MDKDTIGYDDLIGSTVIDLEDRWFDNRWQALGREFRKDPSETINGLGRWDPKPVEKRTLYVPSNNASQACILNPQVSDIFNVV